MSADLPVFRLADARAAAPLDTVTNPVVQGAAATQGAAWADGDAQHRVARAAARDDTEPCDPHNRAPSRDAAAARPAAIELGGRRLLLLPEKAALLADGVDAAGRVGSTLLVADAHIGKAVSFRSLGVPVPRGTTSDTLDRLAALVARHAVRHVVFLGDFLHSARAHAPATLAALGRWREAHASLALTLVRGNHDDRAGDPPASLGFRAVDEPLPLAGWLLCHHPRPRAGGYVLAGHIHPCVSVGGRAHDRLRLPCFHFGAAVGVLPAFGAFTGMHPLRRDPGDRVFAVADDTVYELPG